MNQAFANHFENRLEYILKLEGREFNFKRFLKELKSSFEDEDLFIKTNEEGSFNIYLAKSLIDLKSSPLTYGRFSLENTLYPNYKLLNISSQDLDSAEPLYGNQNIRGYINREVRKTLIKFGFKL